MPAAVVFDFDGTILDTETPEFRSWSEVYRRYGLELPLECWARGVGGAWGVFDPLADLEARLGTRVDREAVAAWRSQRDQELIRAQDVLPGVVPLLDQISAGGVAAAIASSSPRAWVEEHLVRLGLSGYFQVICTADDVERVKPAPDLYRLACRRLGVQPSRALAIEDSPNGALAALAAGLRCVVVPNEVTARLDFPPGTAIRPTLAGVRLADLWTAAGCSPR